MINIKNGINIILSKIKKHKLVKNGLISERRAIYKWTILPTIRR
jgi:hypothetical protein